MAWVVEFSCSTPTKLEHAWGPTYWLGPQGAKVGRGRDNQAGWLQELEKGFVERADESGKRGITLMGSVSRDAFELAVVESSDAQSPPGLVFKPARARKVSINGTPAQQGETKLNDGDKVFFTPYLAFRVRQRRIGILVSSEVKGPVREEVEAGARELGDALGSPVNLNAPLSGDTVALVVPRVPKRVSSTLLKSLSAGIPVVTPTFLCDLAERVRGSRPIADMRVPGPTERGANVAGPTASTSALLPSTELLNLGSDSGQALNIELRVLPSRRRLLHRRTVVATDSRAANCAAACKWMGASEVVVVSDRGANESASLQESFAALQDGSKPVVLFANAVPQRWRRFDHIEYTAFVRAVLEGAPQLPLLAGEAGADRQFDVFADNSLLDNSLPQTLKREPPEGAHCLSATGPTPQVEVNGASVARRAEPAVPLRNKPATLQPAESLASLIKPERLEALRGDANAPPPKRKAIAGASEEQLGQPAKRRRSGSGSGAGSHASEPDEAEVDQSGSDADYVPERDDGGGGGGDDDDDDEDEQLEDDDEATKAKVKGGKGRKARCRSGVAQKSHVNVKASRAEAAQQGGPGLARGVQSLGSMPTARPEISAKARAKLLQSLIADARSRLKPAERGSGRAVDGGTNRKRFRKNRVKRAQELRPQAVEWATYAFDPSKFAELVREREQLEAERAEGAREMAEMAAPRVSKAGRASRKA